jgi:hypothetical protein
MSVEVTRDQADKRQFDGLALRNKNPALVYRWARKDDYQIAMHRYHGYEIVDRREDKVESELNSGTRMKKAEDTDSTIQLGDLVLMSIDKEAYEARRREENDLSMRRQLAAKRSFHNEVRNIAGQSGISYEESDRGGSYIGSMGETEYDRLREETEALDRRSRERRT